MIRERLCRKCQGHIKKGLLLSGCREQKKAAVQGKPYLFIPGDCLGFSDRPVLPRLTHTKAMMPLQNQCRVCLLSQCFLRASWENSRVLAIKTMHDQVVGNTFSSSLVAHPQFLLPYSSYSSFFLRLYMCSFLNITFTTNSVCRPSKYLPLKQILQRQCSVKECIPTSHLQTVALAVLGPCYIRSQQR